MPSWATNFNPNLIKFQTFSFVTCLRNVGLFYATINVLIYWHCIINILYNTYKCISFIIRGQFWPSGIVIACVCVSVCVCVYQSLACPHDNSSAVYARITKFGWEMQNTLVKMPIIFGGDRPWPSRSNLTWKSNFTSFWACPHDNFSLV